MTSTARKKIKAKIAALRAKTSSAGCTESEALAAAELAAKLMAEHGLSALELEMDEAETPEKTRKATWRTTLCGTIAYCTNASAVLTETSWVFIGPTPGPQIACYLYEICTRAVLKEIKAFKASTLFRRRRSLKTKRQAVADFTNGMVNRLRSRLRELFETSISADAASRAKDALALRFPVTRDIPSKPHETRYSQAADLGWSAGNNVPLNRGVGTQATKAAITGGH